MSSIGDPKLICITCYKLTVVDGKRSEKCSMILKYKASFGGGVETGGVDKGNNGSI